MADPNMSAVDEGAIDADSEAKSDAKDEITVRITVVSRLVIVALPLKISVDRVSVKLEDITD